MQVYLTRIRVVRFDAMEFQTVFNMCCAIVGPIFGNAELQYVVLLKNGKCNSSNKEKNFMRCVYLA